MFWRHKSKQAANIIWEKAELHRDATERHKAAKELQDNAVHEMLGWCRPVEIGRLSAEE